MKNDKLSQLDANQREQRMFDEKYDAQRVRLVASDLADINEGLKEAIQNKIDSIEIKFPQPMLDSKPIVVKEIEYKEIEKQVIVEKVVYKEIEKPYVIQVTEYKEIEKQVVVEKIVYKEINTNNQVQDNKFYKIVLIMQTIILIGLLIAIVK